MNNATIIFGTKRLGQTVTKEVAEKYPDLAVITVEGVKEAKKSRRVLLNSKAAELLNLEIGEIQNLVFASVEMGEVESRQVLIANADTLAEEPEVSYKTSKNKVAYSDSKEKGKAITSSHVCNEIFTFLSKDDSANIEFQLNAFDNDALEAYSLDAIGVSTETVEASEGIDELSAPAISAEETADVPVLEGNNGEYTGEQVQESVLAEVARAEAESPVLQEEISEGLPQRNAVAADWMDQ